MCRVKTLSAVFSCVVFTVASLAQARNEADPVPLTNWLLPAEQLSDVLAAPRGDGRRSPRIVSDAVPSDPSTFNSVVPCRVVDTRGAPGPFGGPFFSANQTRTFVAPSGI